MNERKAYIFIGQSGSGKGTQVVLLKEKLLAESSLLMFFELSTGNRFRELLQSETYTVGRTREWMAHGKLPPSFLGIHAWSHELIYSYNAEDVILVDGTPRITEEVAPLIGAFEFLEVDTHVINIVVGDTWAYEKTKNRGREDDIDEERLRGRIAWFHDKVEPVIAQLKADTRVQYIEINGEQTIEEVHQAILKSLSLE